MPAFYHPTVDEWSALQAELAALKGVGPAISELQTARTKLQIDIATLYGRVEALEIATPPVPDPDPDPTDPNRGPDWSRQFLGGYRIAQEFARGVFCIDYAAQELYMRGWQQFIIVYDLAAVQPVASDNPMDYPLLPVKRIIDTPWWPIESAGDCYGLAHFEGKVWCMPRKWYNTTPRFDLTIYAQDGESRTIDYPGGGDAQRFDGFVKGLPGTTPYLGGGAYDSGQGSVSGATAGTMSGEVKLMYEWPHNPGPNLENWNKRAPRPANYSAEGGLDSWVAWQPRVINGVLEGRWASDDIRGGGLVRESEGEVLYFARLGTGELKYSYQSQCFAQDEAHRETWVYAYNLADWTFKEYRKSALGNILGQDQDADGKIYLMEGSRWKSGLWVEDPVLKVFA